MALDAGGGDPCGLLNSSAFPTLWIDSAASEANTFSQIATRGETNTMISVVTATSTTDLDKNILGTSNPNSKFRLVQFLSGGGVGGTGFNKLANVLLKKGNTYETIVDSYIMTQKTNYKTSYGDNNPLTDSDITAIVNALQTAGYLLKKDDIYVAGQMSATEAPAVASQTLLYLYKSEAQNPLSSEQQTRKTLLESRNLRFFGALLAEYCFYRTRYRWLLAKYFNVYRDPYAAPSAGAPAFGLFTGQGSGQTIADNQYSAIPLTQDDYLKGMGYHLAVLNRRMNDLRSILSKISAVYTQLVTEIQNDINASNVLGSNTDLTNVLNTLTTSEKEAKKYLSQKDFLQGAMKYTEEKNRHANILLGLYAFLNLAALAMIYKLR